MKTHGFTIIELLVSIGIFVISSALMLGALFGATEIFRTGEAARQAGDEATAVLAALRSDLARMVPPKIRDGAPATEAGWIYASVGGTAGNVVFSCVIENPDMVTAGASGERAREIITWFVNDQGTPDASDDELRRATYDWAPDGGARAAARSPSPTDGYIVTKGILHFSAWLTLPGNAQAHGAFLRPIRNGQPQWEDLDTAGTDSLLPPWKTEAFDTRPAGWTPGNAYWSTPDAIRVSLVLTGGGRFATRGTLVQDNGSDQVRISGIKALPTIYGSLLRIDNEWVRYENFRNGLVTISANGRGALRSAPATHTDRPTVFAGQPFSLVVALPR